MKIIEFIIISYYIFLRKAKQNQLESSIFDASAIPLLFIAVSLVFWITGYIFKASIHPISVGIIILFFGFAINNLLLKYYLPKKEKLNKLCIKYTKYKLIFMFLILVYYVFSIFIFVYTIRFLAPTY
jgi:hypothetical protein